VEAYTNDVMTIPANLAGIPAVSVPALSGKLPQGVQLMADHFEEKKLLKVARALELDRISRLTQNVH
jgi:aspartyl-tRNA(Asn)/glutamyl-tRNA(Gln) amidotransferase subunit A